jgi:hypothetical protein
MSRFNIPEANSMLYVASLSGSCRANFAYVHACYIFSGGHETGLILCLRRVLGRSWLERIREKHHSKACCSNIRPHGREHTHRRTRYQDIEVGGPSTRDGSPVPGIYSLSSLRTCQCLHTSPKLANSCNFRLETISPWVILVVRVTTPR